MRRTGRKHHHFFQATLCSKQQGELKWRKPIEIVWPRWGTCSFLSRVLDTGGVWPETENEPGTFVRTRKKRDSVWQECGDYSQADYKPEHEERSPFSALGMGRHRNPAWKGKQLSSLRSTAKIKSAGLVTKTLCPASFSYLSLRDKGNRCALHTAFPERNMFSYHIFNWGHALAKKDQHGFDRRHIKINFQYFVAFNILNVSV